MFFLPGVLGRVELPSSQPRWVDQLKGTRIDLFDLVVGLSHGLLGDAVNINFHQGPLT